ncbi:alpha-hydroxy-acid oxidizing protein [Thermopolyspora sp. NPDC052614]|uniref:alpha-hydroxy-acid oxidizing protein n=1 Tax=Thermopolyspora sp. NPDC052614 TaxID=3155682 RepID=UPI00343D2EAB
MARTRPRSGGSRQGVRLADSRPATWSDLDWLRERTSLPIVFKGVLHPGDADRALGPRPWRRPRSRARSAIPWG